MRERNADGRAERPALTRRKLTGLLGSVVVAGSVAGCAEQSGVDEEQTELQPGETESSAGTETDTDGAYDWTFQEVDTGSKPAIALDSQERPHVQYMFENQEGWVKAATWDGSQWNVVTVAEGYFYGPGDIDVGPDDVPRISYHDHQGLSFDPAQGDATFAFPDGETWTVEAVDSSGHDGWDNRIFAASDGTVHISAVDPRDFQGVGVEYFYYDGSEWTVEAVDGPAVTYGWGTSVGADSTGTPHVVFFDDVEQDLVYATKEGDEWVRQRVDTDGEAGMFPDVAVDSRDRPHVSYLRTDGETAVLAYARLDGGSWTTATIDQLPALVISRAIDGKGARNTTSIVLDAADSPIISYSDEQRLKVAVADGDEWTTETVRESGESPFGQITSLRRADDGVLHLAYSTVTGVQPLTGTIWYARGTPR